MQGKHPTRRQHEHGAKGCKIRSSGSRPVAPPNREHQPSMQVRTMQDAFVQAIRYKLQKRVRRLNSADYPHFPMLLRVFFHFFESSPILSGVGDELMARVAEDRVSETIDRILNGEMLHGNNEAESAAMGYL